MKRVTIKDFKDGTEIVGYYLNFGFNVSITVNDIKDFVPKSEWGITMTSAVELFKELINN